MSQKHDWNSWENYLAVHEKTLNNYIKKYYVSGPQVYFVNKLTDQNIELTIRNLILRSQNGNEIEFKIEKTVELDIGYKRPRARTFDYSYHALRPRPLGLNLIRYCSPHDHRPFHHKHVYDDEGKLETVEVPDGAWPHVSEFFDEVLGRY